MHRYRTHTCGALREADIGQEVRLSGWCHRIRDHGGVLFIDLRDHYGLTQVVADPDSPAFKVAETLRAEWVVRIDGKVRRRPDGHRESGPADRRGRGLYPRDRGARPGRRIADAGVRRSGVSGGDPAQVPLPRSAPREAAPEHHDARAGDQFDPPAHEGVGLLRIPDADPDRVVAGRRARLSWCRRGCIPESSTRCRRRRSSSSSSSWSSGFDRYFQIAPCFRDEDARADRSPGEFYQLDLEMSFVTQQDVFDAVEPVHARRVRGVRQRQAGDAEISAHPVCGGDAQIRHRQAGPAQPDRDAERQRGVPRLRLQGLRQHPRQRSEGRGVGDPGARAAATARSATA